MVCTWCLCSNLTNTPDENVMKCFHRCGWPANIALKYRRVHKKNFMHFARSVKVYMICMSQQLGSEIERQGKASQVNYTQDSSS